MNDPVSWRLHVYQMSDRDSQESVADLLSRVNDLTVECTGPLFCLTVTCRNRNQARSVHRLVTLSDTGAVLINATYGVAVPAPNPIEASR